MDTRFSAGELADEINHWCEQNQIEPASGQASGRLSERNIRFYRSLGLVDSPGVQGGHGYGHKQRLQLIALRLLQAKGLPLNKIRELLFGRSLEDLKRIEREGLAELESASPIAFRPSQKPEQWGMTPLDGEFLLISRRGRRLSGGICERLRAVLRTAFEKQLDNGV